MWKKDTGDFFIVTFWCNLFLFRVQGFWGCHPTKNVERAREHFFFFFSPFRTPDGSRSRRKLRNEEGRDASKETADFPTKRTTFLPQSRAVTLDVSLSLKVHFSRRFSTNQNPHFFGFRPPLSPPRYLKSPHERRRKKQEKSALGGVCRESAGETYGEGLHLLDDLVGSGGHGDDTTAGDGLGAHEGGAESLGGGGVRNLRDGMGRKKRKRKKGGKNVAHGQFSDGLFV